MSSAQEIQATDGYAMSGPVQSIVSANEYEVSTLCDDSSTIPLELGEDAIPPMHMLQEVTSEDEEDDDAMTSSDDNEKYKMVDDTSEDYTPDLGELAAADSDGGHDSDNNVKNMDDNDIPPLLLHMSAVNDQKKYTFHEYTQSNTKNLVVKRVDEPSGPVTCKWENCNRTFDTPEQLSKHIDFEHNLSEWICRWVPCTRHFKPFDARYKLLVHLRCHTGEKPYNCTIPGCTRKFSRIENMKLHVRTHTGEKPYVCSYEGCTKKFNNSSDRAKHAKTHVSTKPYKCKFPGCEKYYTDPSSMRKHYRSTHFDKGHPKPLPTNLINSGTISASNVTGLTVANCVIPGVQGTQPDYQVSVANTNTNNNNLFQVPVPVFQLPSVSTSDGSGGGGSNVDMLQLIQQEKMQPILLQNGTQQPLLMFVPTATVQQGGQQPALIPVQQPLQPQQQQKPQQHLIISSLQPDKSTNDNKPSGSAEQQVKNVRVIVSSGKVNKGQTV